MKITKFRLFNLFAILLILATKCTSDGIGVVDIYNEYIPEKLNIVEAEGIKLEEVFVENQVSMNVKLSQPGMYRIKIKDLAGKVISQERLQVKEGNNILSVYTSTLPKSSYTIELQDDNHIKLGSSIFVIK